MNGFYLSIIRKKWFIIPGKIKHVEVTDKIPVIINFKISLNFLWVSIKNYIIKTNKNREKHTIIMH